MAAGSHPTTTKLRTGYLPTLDGWRTVAIVMVLCAHMHDWPRALERVRQVLQPNGALGVDLFFAISGLLICHRLLEEERLCGKISLKGFYIRRSFRIFPPAFLYLAVIAICGILQILPTAWPTWLSAVFFLRNYASMVWTDNAQTLYTAHFWSLAVEEHFYLILPALLFFFPRRRDMVLLILAVVAFAWLGFYGAGSPHPLLWGRRTDLHIASLLFPACLTVFLANTGFRTRLRNLLRPGVVLLVLMVAIVVGKSAAHLRTVRSGIPQQTHAETYGGKTTTYTDAHGHILEAVSPEYGTSAPSLLRTYGVPLLAPFLILSTLFYPESWIGRFLELPLIRWIGRLSYSLYLWQQLFWDGRSYSWPIYNLQRHESLGLLLSFAVAACSFYWVERPLIRIGHRLAPPATSGHRDTPAAAT